MIVDANILLSAALGSSVRLENAVDRGLELMIPDAQLFEAVKVLTKKFGFETDEARTVVDCLADQMTVLSSETLISSEEEARARLEPRGQSDWPVLAAAMLLDGHIWSKDRDFFGVGVPVWTTRNIKYAGTANV
jgi:predicted nucleic acid-binding protein